MADLNIRNINSELLKALKVSAAENGLTLREWCVTLLADNAEVAVHLEGEEEGVQDVSRVLASEKVSKRAPKVRKVKSPPVVQESSLEPEIEDEDIPDLEPEFPMCAYREYDSESGETYGCRLREHGPKVKHQRGDKL